MKLNHAMIKRLTEVGQVYYKRRDIGNELSVAEITLQRWKRRGRTAKRGIYLKFHEAMQEIE